MIKCTIDNKEIEVEEGTTILQAANNASINIPTMCLNDDVKPIGSCRICVVEIVKEGKSCIVSSCNTPVSDGIIIYTKSEASLNARKYAIELINSLNPNIPFIQKLMQDYGINSNINVQKSECIHCGKCAHICSNVVEQHAITKKICGFSYGNEKTSVEWDFSKCIACGSCAYGCPTGAVKIIDKNGVRTIITPNSKHEFALKKCTNCGKYFAPKVQIDYMVNKTGLPEEKFDECMDCR